MTYFAIHTMPNCEDRAARHLRAQQCEVYYPRIVTTIRHARRLTEVMRPFLPRYMFVRDDGRGVSFIKRSIGVSDVVRAGLEPIRVRPGVIAQMQARADERGFIRLDERETPEAFRPGALLRFTDDSQFSGFNAIFRRMKGETRALIFLCLAIRQIPMEVPVEHLERAA